jgi:coproporphyrinogen III oxidase-like Fe-S oxidoreductase
MYHIWDSDLLLIPLKTIRGGGTTDLLKSTAGYFHGKKMPVEGSETLSSDQLRLERLYLGFRTENGVSLDDISGSDSKAKVLSKLKQSGLVKIHNNMIMPTLKGYLMADSLPLMFTD